MQACHATTKAPETLKSIGRHVAKTPGRQEGNLLSFKVGSVYRQSSRRERCAEGLTEKSLFPGACPSA